jgi:tetratricopeptide (TPR) repeat protein
MVRDLHLTPEEIEQALGYAEVSESGTLTPPSQIQQHLAVCETCQTRLDRYKVFDVRLADLRSHEEPSQSAECPTDREWLEVAAGSAPDKQAHNLLEHAAGCHNCAILLRRAINDLTNEGTAEEEAVLAELASSKTEWQRQLVLTLTAAQASRWRPLQGIVRRIFGTGRSRARWVYSVAVLVLLVVALTQFLWNRRQEDPLKLLADAYSEERTLELRFPNARYAPFRQQRGSGTSMLNRPDSLLRAAAAIRQGLARNPDDPTWLEAKARLDLLDWKYEEAIRSLKEALDAQPDSPALASDLGTAYFERAEAEGRALDYGTAIEWLSKALAKKPDDPVALFNRAIVYERIFVIEQAIRDWEHYLRVDPAGEWGAEARRHLAELKSTRNKSRAGSQLVNPWDFVRFAEGLAGLAEPSAVNQIDSQIEEYLEIAIKQWLPAVYLPASGQAGSRNADSGSAAVRGALRILARIAAARHGDKWLADLLSTSGSAAFGQALQELGRAFSANQEGDHETAERIAQQAARRFHQTRNKAGELRSRLEEVYALHRSLRGDRCVAAARTLQAGLQGRGYLWMEGQLLLEESICRDMLGNLGAALEEAKRAGTSSRTARYRTLNLRSVGITAGIYTEMGNTLRAWNLNQEGLREYWAGFYPPLRAYQFYADLVTTAEDLGQWQLALGLHREAVRMTTLARNSLVEAMARYRLATAATLAGASIEARSEFQHADRLFAALPQDQVTLSYRMSSDVFLANLELRNGNLDDSLARMVKVRSSLPRMADYLVPLAFYVTLGTLNLQRHHYEEGERALRSAVAIGEVALESLTSDEDRLTWDRQVAAAYRGLVEIKLRRDEDFLGALELWEWYRALPLRSTNSNAYRHIPERSHIPQIDFARLEASPPLPPVMSMQEIVSSLRNETVLSFAQMPGGLAIWVFDNRGVHAKWIPVTAETIKARVRRFGQLCADPTSRITSLRAEGQQLYQYLIAPLGRYLDARRTLIIESDGALSAVPMQALTDFAGEYLGSRFNILSSLGVAYWQQSSTASRLTTLARILVVGTPALSGEMAMYFPPLPDAAREARTIASRFQGAILLSGNQATAAAVRREVENATIFHFAGHALVNAVHSGWIASCAVRRH